MCFKDNKSSTKLTTIVNSEQPLPSVLIIEYADNIHLSDCRFIENKGTPIAVYYYYYYYYYIPRTGVYTGI